MRNGRAMPELATNVHRLVKRVTGNADPYSQLKDKYTSFTRNLTLLLKLLKTHY